MSLTENLKKILQENQKINRGWKWKLVCAFYEHWF